MKKKRNKALRERRIEASMPASLQFDGGLVEIQAAAQTEGDQPQPRRFSMEAYNGGLLRLANFRDPVVVDLQGMIIPSRPIAILRDHDQRAIVGRSEQIKIEGSAVYVSGLISSTAHANEVVELSLEGFPWQASIGAGIEGAYRVPTGKSVSVNGQIFRGPVVVATRTRLREVSFTAVGVDSTTSAQVAASAAQSTEENMNFEKWLEAKGFVVADLSDDQRATLNAAYDAEQSPADDPAPTPAPEPAVDPIDPVAEIRAKFATEAKRVEAIRDICAKYESPKIKIDGAEVALESHAIEAGWDLKETELEAMRASRPRLPAILAPTHDLDTAVVEAALCMSGGMPEEVVANTILGENRERVMNTAISAQYRGMGLHALMDITIQAAGKHYAGSRKSNEYIRAAFEAQRELQAHASTFSTVSLSGILGAVANKSMVASYDAVETTWQEICGVKSHSDFKVHTRYRLDSKGSFRKVGPDGELKHVGMSEASFTSQLDTFGAMIALTRQQMINDDLGAFLEIPNMIGRMAAVRIEEAVYVLILGEAGTFFSAGNKNYFDGASSALDIDSLTTGRQKFRNFVDTNGKPVLVSPKILLVGNALETTAINLFKETSMQVTTSANNRKFANNEHVGKYKPVVAGYLDNTDITDEDGEALAGQSATQWYLFADPKVRPAVIVAFLNGQRRPTIESSEMDFDKLGMAWRGYHDFGVGFEDPKGAVKSKGAA